MTLNSITKLIEANKEALLISSLVFYILLPILIVVLIIYLPPNYFIKKSKKKGNTWWTWSKFILKNLVGLILIGLGLLMVILPGPGIIVTVIGLMLTQFPGKNKIKDFFLKKKLLRKQLNWIRRKSNKKLFTFS